MIKNLYCVIVFGLALLFSSCLSLKIVLHLPQKSGGTGTIELEYYLSESLQNISNYSSLRADIAPLPLPLWERDFRGIAAQSPTIRLESYSFRQAKKKSEKGLVQAKLSFASEADLRLLLGPEIQWRDQQFHWQLSAASAESLDASYPQLDGELSKEERQILLQFFDGQSLEIEVSITTKQKARQQLSLADFVTGEQNIDLNIMK